MLEGGKCEEEAAPNLPFCHAHHWEHALTGSFGFCEQHEVVHLRHFRCPACVLADLGYKMDVLHDKYPHGETGKYIKGKDIL